MRKPLPLLAAALPLLLCSCAFLKDLAQASFQNPTLTFKAAHLADVSLGGATVNLTYVLENPNPIGLSLAEVGYAFSVEGRQVVAGMPAMGLKIPASGQTELVFPASVKFADLASALHIFLTKEHAAYRAEGFLGIQTPLGVLRVPIAKEGTFDVPKLPKIQLGSPRITGISFDGAQVQLPVTLTNVNGFPLPIGGLDGALQLGGSTVSTMSTGDFGAVPAQGSRQITLPLTLRFRDAASALSSLTGGKPVTMGFNGQLKSGPFSLPMSFTQTVNFQR
jgi:LEA14-like dessication related protein